MAAPREQQFLATAIGGAGGRIIASPFQFWSTGEDALRVVSANSLAGVAIKIQGRFLATDGSIRAASWDHTPNTDRSTKTQDYPLAAGAVLNLTVFARTGAPQIGQTFVIVQLVRGVGTAAIVLGTLLAGYVTSTQALAWPGSAVQSSTEGEPPPRSILGTDPALGTYITEVVPTGARWELLSVWCSHTQGGLATVRAFIVDLFDNSGLPTAILAGGASGGAGITDYVTFAQGVPVTTRADAGAPNEANGPLPINNRLLAGQGFIITMTIVSAAFDDFSAPRYAVREWLEVP